MMVHNFFFSIGRIPDKGVKKTSVLELILPLLRYYLFESFVVVSLFPIDSEYESVMPQTGVITKLFLFHMKKTDQKFSNLLKLL